MNSCYKGMVGAADFSFSIALSATRDDISVLPIVPVKDSVEQGFFIIEHQLMNYSTLSLTMYVLPPTQCCLFVALTAQQ